MESSGTFGHPRRPWSQGGGTRVGTHGSLFTSVEIWGPSTCQWRQMRGRICKTTLATGPPAPAPAAHPTPFLSRQAGMQMRGRGGYSLTSPTGKESARHFFSAIHQVQTGATSPSLFPEPTPGRTWKQDWAAWGSASWAGLPDPQGWAGVKKGRRARSRPVTLLSCAPCPPFLASVTFDLLREGACPARPPPPELGTSSPGKA